MQNTPRAIAKCPTLRWLHVENKQVMSGTLIAERACIARNSVSVIESENPMIRVKVAPYKLKRGGWTKKRITWATFKIQQDALEYVARLWSANPDWLVYIEGK